MANKTTRQKKTIHTQKYLECAIKYTLQLIPKPPHEVYIIFYFCLFIIIISYLIYTIHGLPSTISGLPPLCTLHQSQYPYIRRVFVNLQATDFNTYYFSRCLIRQAKADIRQCSDRNEQHIGVLNAPVYILDFTQHLPCQKCVVIHVDATSH